MLRALITAFCAVSLTYSLAQSKRTTDTRIATVSLSPTGPTDGSISPDARFAIAAANTTVLYSASFNLGASCAEQGWTTVDATAQPGTFWHIDDFAGVNVDVGDSYAPLAGAKSLWCGTRAASSGALCLYAVLPGYGDGWHQAWRTKMCLAVSGDLDLSFLLRIDSEPNYDAAFLEYTDQCGAEYRDASWALLAGGTGAWDGVQSISHAASYDVGAGPVEVRIRFASDGAFSDEDGDYDSHGGPVVIDDLDVEGLALETFEDEAVGATSSDDWEADLFPGFGDHFALFPGASLLQEDTCAKNLSCAWAAIAGSTDTYACGGHPEQIAVPVGLGTGGLYIDNSIESPPIALTGNGSRVNLQFSVYRDLAISRGVVYTWSVRGVTNGCPGPWGNRNTVYFGDQKDWKVDVFAIEDLIDLSTSTHVQVRLGVFDRCGTQCGIYTQGDCHSHAPLFDNVMVYRVDVGGPTFVVNDFDMFQDTFPADGSDTGIGRADMARSITPSASPTIQPGDSCVFICSDPLTAVAPSNPTGLADDLALGGKQVYAWVHVIDSGVPSVTKTGAALTDDPVRYPLKDTQVADSKTWTRIRCDLASANLGRFRIDLNDNLFEAGDVIEFFFGATNTLGETSYCSGSALDYVQFDADVAAAAASEFTILPLVPGGFGTDIFYVDGMDGRGAQELWDSAFDQIYAADRYDVRGPTSAVSNRPSTRVSDVATQLNGNYNAIAWDCGDLAQGLGDGKGTPEKSDDYAMLITFLGGVSSSGGVYICGDDAPSSLAAATGPSAITFRSAYVTFTMTTGDHRPSFGIAPAGVSTGDHLDDSIVIYGGCPLLNDFDVMTPTGSSVSEMTYGSDTGTNAAVVSKTTGNARVFLSGFSLVYVRDDDEDGVLDRARHLNRILRTMNTGVIGNPTDAPPILVDRLEQNYPNPFNPQTTIAFSISERERVRIDVFNVAGEHVRALLDETRAAGSYTDVRWDGTNAVNQPVASGIYFYRIESGDFSQTRKMVLLK